MNIDMMSQAKHFFSNENQWVVQVGAILLITLIIFVCAFLFLSYFKKRHARAVVKRKQEIKETKPAIGIWGWGFFTALHAPLYAAIWIVGVINSLEVIYKRFPALDIFALLKPAQTILLILVLFWFLQRFVTYTHQFALSIKGPKKPDLTTVQALTKIGRLVNWVIVILVVLQEVGVPLSGVVAFGGGSAVVVGIAAKDLLANFFGGWVVIMDKPFKVGDWIASPDRNIEGTVEYIGWRSTRIRTFDKRPLYVPNAVFTTIAIENPSRMLNRRIKQVVGVRYNDASKVTQISAHIEKMLRAHEAIDQAQTIFVSLINFGASSLDLLIYCFTKTTAWVEFQKIQEDVMVKILEIIYELDAEAAFPTRTIVAANNVDLARAVEEGAI